MNVNDHLVELDQILTSTKFTVSRDYDDFRVCGRQIFFRSSEEALIPLSRLTPAHTDTDTSVLFANANVQHAGDTFFKGSYPFIDYNSGGSIDLAIQRNLVTLGEEDGR